MMHEDHNHNVRLTLSDKSIASSLRISKVKGLIAGGDRVGMYPSNQKYTRNPVDYTQNGKQSTGRARGMRNILSDQAKTRRVLRIGDLCSYFLSTLVASLILPIGGSFSLSSVVETFLLFALIWLVAAPFLGLYRAAIATNAQRLWVAGALALVATPLGAWLGEIWLGYELQMDFVLLVTILAAVILVSWRFAFIKLGIRYLE
jgi:hypothetical protein